MVIFQIILFIIILHHTHTTQRNDRGTRYALSLTQWLSLRSDNNKTNPTDNRCALWTEDKNFFSPFVTCALYEHTVDNWVRHVETFPHCIRDNLIRLRSTNLIRTFIILPCYIYINVVHNLQSWLKIIYLWNTSITIK